MAKFCTKCGSPLEDGKCPKCDKEKEEKKETKEVKETTETVEVTSNEMVESFKDIITNIFKTPVKVVKKYATEANMTFGLVAAGINAVAIGLLVHVLIDNILKIAGLSIKTINSVLSNPEVSQVFTMLGINAQNTNFGVKAAIGMAILTAITAGIIYLMANVVFKKKLDFKKIIPIVGLSETFLTIAAIVAIILSYVNVALALIVFSIIAMFSITTLHQIINETTDLDSNEVIYTTAAAITIPVLAIGFIVSVIAIIYIGMASTAAYMTAVAR